MSEGASVCEGVCAGEGTETQREGPALNASVRVSVRVRVSVGRQSYR